MSRQLEQGREERESKRRDALVRALDHSLYNALELDGVTFIGFAVKFDSMSSLMTLKADIGGVRSVSFVGGSTVIDCILDAVRAARNGTLRWKVDKYSPTNT